MGDASPAEKLKAVYRLLLERYGPQRWWPGETPFEVMTGAVLTQSAAWGNVEKAIGNLKAAGKLSAAALRDIPAADLAVLIYPSGYYNAKARKLKALVEWLGNYGDDLSRLDRRDSQGLREELLGVHGIGPETADSILLYALGGRSSLSTPIPGACILAWASSLTGTLTTPGSGCSWLTCRMRRPHLTNTTP